MFHYNNGLLATSGFDGGGSCVQPSLTQDAFWIWTAHANGDYLFEVLGAIYETGVKIYAGTDCTATCVAAAGPSSWGFTELELPGVNRWRPIPGASRSQGWGGWGCASACASRRGSLRGEWTRCL